VANTNYYKSHVEPYVRAQLERRYGVQFSSRTLALTTGGMHEFDAVSSDGSIVTSIKSLSARTRSNKRPAAKYLNCVAELYFLSLVDAPQRLLILTTPAWHAMFTSYIENRLHPGIAIELLELSPELQAEVDRVRDIASAEMAPSRSTLGANPNGTEDPLLTARVPA
jgi:hypothetical protein